MQSQLQSGVYEEDQYLERFIKNNTCRKQEGMYKELCEQNSNNSDVITKACHNKRIMQHIESILYQYPMWEVNLFYFSETGDVEADKLSFASIGYVGGKMGIVRRDYQIYLNYIDSILVRLSSIEEQFVRHRYFEKAAFKIIADKLAVTERHLYRIKNQVLYQFAVAFGFIT